MINIHNLAAIIHATSRPDNGIRDTRNDLVTTVRVYPNGDKTYNGVAPEELENHLAYNRDFRFGCDVFVNGVLTVKSEVYYDTEERRERLRLIGEELLKENWKTNKLKKLYQ